MKLAENVGQMQVKLEAAMEHLSYVVAAALNEHGFTFEDFYGRHGGGKDKRRFEVGSMEYGLAAIHNYLTEALQGSYLFAGTTDGQLCPYEDCAHDLGIPGVGWYRCPNCQRAFFVTDSDSDIETCHTQRHKGEVLPDNVPFARDLGPSWATPGTA